MFFLPWKKQTILHFLRFVDDLFYRWSIAIIFLFSDLSRKFFELEIPVPGDAIWEIFSSPFPPPIKKRREKSAGACTWHCFTEPFPFEIVAN